MAMEKDAVQRLLADALAAVEGAKVTEDLRPIAFTKALDLLAGAAPVPSPAGDGSGGGSGGSNSRSETFTGDERLTKIGQKTGADVSKLPYVFDVEEDGVTILIKRSKLSNGDAPATRELALLVAAARQAAGYEATTNVETIREAVENMGVYDPKNFSTDLKKITGVTIKGSGNARELKVTQHAFEEAGKLIARIAGGDS